jgi:flagella basal body P-ring formation protein FlgA
MKPTKQYGILLVASLLLLLMCTCSAWANQHHGRGGQRLEPERIRSAVRRHIQRHAPWDTEQMTIKKIHFNRPVHLPPGKVGIQVTASKHTDWLGAVGFSVDVMVNGKKEAAVTVPVKIEVWSDVILTTKPLGRYQPIGRGDVQVKKMDLARVPSNVIVEIEQVVGSRTNRRIAANCILRQDHVEMPPIVKRGDLVSVVAESACLKISIKAMAKEDGRIGDRIKVVNLRSKKGIYALVVDDHTVRVEF